MAHNGQHKGQEYVVNGNGVQQHARKQQDNVDHQQHDPRIAGNAQQYARAFFHQSNCGAHPRIQTGTGYHNHNNGRGFGGFCQNFNNNRQAVDGAVNKNAHKKAIKDSHGRGFCWGKHAAVDAAQNDHRGHYAPKGFAQGLANRLLPWLALVSALARDKQYRTHDKGGHHHAGHKARRKQGWHGYIRNAAIHDKGYAGRDNNSQPRRYGNGCRGKGLFVPGIGHAGNENKPQRGHSGRARAANRTPKCGNSHGGHGQTAGHGTNQGLHKRHYAGGNARPLHNVARQNKEGYGKQRKFGYSCKKVVGKHGNAHVPLPHNH